MESVLLFAGPSIMASLWVVAGVAMAYEVWSMRIDK